MEFTLCDGKVDGKGDCATECETPSPRCPSDDSSSDSQLPPLLYVSELPDLNDVFRAAHMPDEREDGPEGLALQSAWRAANDVFRAAHMPDEREEEREDGPEGLALQSAWRAADQQQHGPSDDSGSGSEDERTVSDFTAAEHEPEEQKEAAEDGEADKYNSSETSYEDVRDWRFGVRAVVSQSQNALLTHRRWRTRVKAWTELSRFNGELDIAIGAHLNHPNAHVRLRAVSSMSSCFAENHKERIAALVMGDPSPRVRAAALQELSHARYDEGEELIISCVSRVLSHETDIQLLTTAMDVLRDLLTSPNVAPYKKSIVDMLAGQVMNPEARIRCAAVKALARASWSGLVPTALGLTLEDEDATVRKATLCAMGQLTPANDEGWPSAAVKLLQDSDWRARAMAAQYFGRKSIKWNTAPNTVRAVLNIVAESEVWEERLAALMALGFAAAGDAFVGNKACETVAQALQDPIAAVREAAAQFFARCRDSGSLPSTAVQTTSRLLSRTGGHIDTPGFLRVATFAMGYIGLSADPDLITHLLSHSDWVIRREAAKSLKRIYMGRTDNNGILEAITPLLKDPHQRVRVAVEELLEQARDKDDSKESVSDKTLRLKKTIAIEARALRHRALADPTPTKARQSGTEVGDMFEKLKAIRCSKPNSFADRYMCCP